MAVRLLFVDIDTQIDFVNRRGALYVPGSEEIVPTLARLTRFAEERNIPVLSSVDTHVPNDPEFEQFPPHCIDGTSGQGKHPDTLFRGAARVVSHERKLPPNEIPPYQPGQILFKKSTLDVFTNPNAAPYVRGLGPLRAVLYGVATDYCVLAASKPLAEICEEVLLVEDAVRGVAPDTTESALQSMRESGIRLTISTAILSGEAI